MVLCGIEGAEIFSSNVTPNSRIKTYQITYPTNLDGVYTGSVHPDLLILLFVLFLR